MGQNLIGKKVYHKTYGVGSIVSCDDTNVTVLFETQEEEKLFSFPKSFEKFLCFEDDTLQKSVLENIEKQKDKKSNYTEYELKKNQGNRFATVRLGDSFNTHAEVLNECFGYDYKHYQPGYKKLAGNRYAVWFPNIAVQRDGKFISTDRSSGWINVLKNKGRSLIQMDKEGKQNPDSLERLVFAKNASSERYMFIGLFGKGKHIEGGVEYTRISEEFDLKNMIPILENEK